MQNACKALLPQFNTIMTNSILHPSKPLVWAVQSKAFHALTANVAGPLHGVNNTINTNNNSNGSSFLMPQTAQLIPSCGFKVKGRVKRRCKSCFLVMRDGRMFNFCKDHPRHKQMALVKQVRNTWILTHATQSKVRPW